MKKIISLAICVLVLCLFCMPVYAGSEAMEQAKTMVRWAKSAKDEGEYISAGQYYYCAGTSFAYCPQYYLLAAYAYGLSADAYSMGGSEDDAALMRDWQADYASRALNISGQVSVSEVFNGDNLIESSGFTLSEGNITIIVGIAAAVIFGLGGFFAGKAAGKKKPALAGGAESDEE